jgi:hypothetical protein
MKMARKLGQKILPNEILLSDMLNCFLKNRKFIGWESYENAYCIFLTVNGVKYRIEQSIIYCVLNASLINFKIIEIP